MSSASKPHSKPSTDNPDVLTVYYGIHDALRELGDDLNDAGDGPGLDTPHVIAGLWDASSALSRLFEQHEALTHERDFLREENAGKDSEIRVLEEQLEALREALEWCNDHRDSERFHSVAESALNRVSSPASEPETANERVRRVEHEWREEVSNQDTNPQHER